MKERFDLKEILEDIKRDEAQLGDTRKVLSQSEIDELARAKKAARRKRRAS